MTNTAQLKIKRPNGQVEIVNTPYTLIYKSVFRKIVKDTASAGRGDVLCVIHNGVESMGIEAPTADELYNAAKKSSRIMYGNGISATARKYACGELD